MWRLDDGVRIFEVLTALARAHGDGRPLSLAALSKRLVDTPVPKQIRRWLQPLEQQQLVVFDGDGAVSLVVDPGESVLPSPSAMKEALLRLQKRICDDDGLRKAMRLQFESVIANADVEIARSHTSEALAQLASGPRRGNFLTQLEQRTSTASRPLLALAAHTIAGKASMVTADVPAALAHVRRAERWALDAKGASATDWRIQLAAVHAAAQRMRAALYPTEAEEALHASEAAFRQGIDLAFHGVDLPADLRRLRLRWLTAEATTPMGIRADLAGDGVRAADREAIVSNLRGADDLLGLGISDASEVPATGLLWVREAALRGAGDDASARLQEVKVAAASPGCPIWVKGWIPRYEADVYLAINPTDRTAIRQVLLDGWRLNEGLTFQRLMVLARFGLLGLEPIEGHELSADLANVRREMMGMLGRWHSELRGRPPSKCARCRDYDGSPGRGFVRRIQCTLGVDSARAGVAQIGVWR